MLFNTLKVTGSNTGITTLLKHKVLDVRAFYLERSQKL